MLWVAVVHPKEKPPINVVGDVAGHIAIVVVCYIAVLYHAISVLTFRHFVGWLLNASTTFMHPGKMTKPIEMPLCTAVVLGVDLRAGSVLHTFCSAVLAKAFIILVHF